MIRIRRRLLILAGVIVSGCATTEPLPTFYTLREHSADQLASRQKNARPVRVYVNRAVIPSYLGRTNLASFQGNQVRYSNSAFWADPLDQAIPQAIAGNLSGLGVPAAGFQPMFNPPSHAYDLELRISRCEGYDNGDVVFSGTWGIHSAGEAGSTSVQSFDIHRSGWQPGDYPQLARLLADAVSECSRRIAADLRR
jgi:uncharacterized lipoprotein YmbA